MYVKAVSMKANRSSASQGSSTGSVIQQNPLKQSTQSDSFQKADISFKSNLSEPGRETAVMLSNLDRILRKIAPMKPPINVQKADALALKAQEAAERVVEESSRSFYEPRTLSNTEIFDDAYASLERNGAFSPYSP